jgi:prepilin-type N-terminal cleavage/methylation domain-containing protein
MNTTPPDTRRGITLLEVLIAIGILAIGLSSIVAVMPAAHSQAKRAVILDRAALLAINALADAATFGLLRPSGAVLTPAATAATPVLIDPAATSAYLTNTALGAMRGGGVSASTLLTPAPAAVVQTITQLRDDVVFPESPIADDPPYHGFSDGVRTFEGRMSCALLIRPGAASGMPGTVSAVVFHARDTGSPLAVTGTVQNLRVDQATLNTTELAGRRMRDVIKPGVILWDPTTMRFHQAAATSYDMGGTSAYLTLSSGTALVSGTFTVQFLPDSVGIAERPFFPETVSEFAQ